MPRHPSVKARAALLARAEDRSEREGVQITCVNPSASVPAFVFIADETALHQKLGVFEVRG